MSFSAPMTIQRSVRYSYVIVLILLQSSPTYCILPSFVRANSFRLLLGKALYDQDCLYVTISCWYKW